MLITEKFYQYLIKQGALTPETTFETFEENEAHFSKDLAIIQAYLNYDIRDKNVDAGFAHPGVLQALAHIQKVDLRIWHTGENQALQAHRGAGYDYAAYTPSMTERRVDLLFSNGNHFDLLEFSGYEHGVPDTEASIFPYIPATSFDPQNDLPKDIDFDLNHCVVGENCPPSAPPHLIVPESGMTYNDVAKMIYGTARLGDFLANANGGLHGDDPAPLGTSIPVPSLSFWTGGGGGIVAPYGGDEKKRDQKHICVSHDAPFVWGHNTPVVYASSAYVFSCAKLCTLF